MKKTCVFNRQPFDTWYFDLYNQIVKTFPDNVESYYMWSVDESWNRLVRVNFKSDIIFIFITDNLQYYSEYDPKVQQRTIRAETLLSIVNRYKHKTFIVSTMMEKLELEISAPNLHLLCHGGLHFHSSQDVVPILNKNFSTDTPYLCLNRQPRIHRLTVVSYILGQNLEKFGYVSYNTESLKDYTTWLDRCNWTLTQDQQNQILEKIELGFQKLKDNEKNQIKDLIDVDRVYSKKVNDNTTNFNLYLRPLYENSFVQIVTESNFAEPGIMLTEKTAQAILGGNFFIIIGSAGAVQHLRKIGFDVFDDVINHHYDNELNLLDRIVKAIDLNKRLITNRH